MRSSPILRFIALALVAMAGKAGGSAAQPPDADPALRQHADPAPQQQAAPAPFVFPTSNLVAAAEAFGATVPRAIEPPTVPALYGEVSGTADRRCSVVDREQTVVRSGEMLVGGHLGSLEPGQNKVWWKPLDSSLDMEIDVVGVALDAPNLEAAFELGPPTAPYSNESPPRKIAEEAFFPGGARFPSAGRWIAVATSGESWGCFIFEVPPRDTPGGPAERR